jgi:hypothetical protein
MADFKAIEWRSPAAPVTDCGFDIEGTGVEDGNGGGGAGGGTGDDGRCAVIGKCWSTLGALV